MDGFASGTEEAAYLRYFGSDLGKWIQRNLGDRL